jgi:hypothetical protein
MQKLFEVLFSELVDVLFLLAFKRPKTMHGELQHHRRQQKERRMKISDAQYEEIKARWTERTNQGERPGTVKGEAHDGTTTKQVSR